MGHLTADERRRLETLLNRGESFRSIAEALGKSHSTISREIRKHRTVSSKTVSPYILNNCTHRSKCSVEKLCRIPTQYCKKKCSACTLVSCNKVCAKFELEECPALLRSPWVCNGCKVERRCSLTKYYYIAEKAEQKYKSLLKSARKGINLTEDELKQVSDIIAVGASKGQSIHHILQANANCFTICEKTVYTLINTGAIKTKRYDLPAACSRKKRKHKAVEHKINTKCRNNRSFEDFKNFLHNNPGIPVVEMDTVIGRPGQKALLTMHFNNCGMMLAFIREANNAQTVIDIFDHLEKVLGLEMFPKMFPVILTDNGSEFSNPDALEQSCDKTQKRTKIFYCDPYSSWQKPHVENNHTNLRKILPKGKSFNNLTQADVNKIISHLNSYNRKSFNDKTALEMFAVIYGKEVIQKLNINAIHPNQVIMTPDLIG